MVFFHSLVLVATLVATATAATYPAPQIFAQQRQDHFSGDNANVWSQFFYVNDTFWKGASSGAPIFLCVGGEGPAFDGSVVVDSVHCSNAAQWLEENGALMVALQHRYYGCHAAANGTGGSPGLLDCPINAFTQNPNEDLKYHSSHQALSDVANFHQFIVEKYALTSSNKWISFGGSYPGMLAAWTRLKFPHLIHAAVSSSAPVHAKLEMQEYNNIAADAYSVEMVGGSINCTRAIAQGHAMIGSLLKTKEGRTQLTTDFVTGQDPEWLADPTNARGFAGEGVAYFPSQGNDPMSTAPFSNIELICKTMVDASLGDEVKRLSLVTKGQRAVALAGVAGAHTHMEMIAPWLKRARFMDGPGWDLWSWQTCNEFGFYQTCDIGSRCMYTQGLDLLVDEMAFCETDYKIATATVQANINQTNLYYGSDTPVGSRVLWVNGQVDPWHGLSVNTALPGMPILYVKGASHHAWTHPMSDCSQQTVLDARAAIRKQVTAWLAEE
jgi:pimeloyl-ACP methyl ester carboxylesterase